MTASLKTGDKQSEDGLIGRVVKTNSLLLPSRFRLIHHEPRVNFCIHSEAMHGDVRDITPLSAFCLQASNEAGYHGDDIHHQETDLQVENRRLETFVNDPACQFVFITQNYSFCLFQSSLFASSQKHSTNYLTN